MSDQPSKPNNLLLPPPAPPAINLLPPVAIGDGAGAGSKTLGATLGSNLTNTGSATGNPRNKCALKPGYSLMGWVRLGNSGVDLAGTRGRIVAVTIEELAKHNREDDAWMAIRGKVYNVTRYIDYHPGGADELLRGVGRDATLLFNEVHAWVNYQQLLAKCYVGPLRSSVQIDKTLHECSVAADGDDGGDRDPFALPVTTAAGRAVQPKLVEIVPRFDWLQKRDEVTFCIYTRARCNPGLLLQRREQQPCPPPGAIERGGAIEAEVVETPIEESNCSVAWALHMHLLIPGQVDHLLSLDLHRAVLWPPKLLKVGAAETGKIEVTFRKGGGGGNTGGTATEALWTSYGAHTLCRVDNAGHPGGEGGQEDSYDFELIRKEAINHDSWHLQLRSCRNKVIMWPPIGCHVDFILPIEGEFVRRSYTPVPAQFLNTPADDEAQANRAQTAHDLHFLIKFYEEGHFTKHLRLHLEQGDATVRLTRPKGNFQLEKLLPHRNFLLLAAGSGLTPFLAVIEQLLKRHTNRIEELQLFYFNKTSADAWCREALTRLQTTDERFRWLGVHSQPVAVAEAAKSDDGPLRLCEELLQPFLATAQQIRSTFVAVCGPIGFNQLARDLLLQQFKLPPENFHVFQG